MNATDLEMSTFQDRPAYRYIRASDKLPTTDAAHAAADPVALVKVFNPTGDGTWHIAGYDPDTRIAYGVANIGYESEIGDFDMTELVDFRGRFGLPIERDLSFTATSLKELLS